MIKIHVFLSALLFLLIGTLAVDAANQEELDAARALWESSSRQTPMDYNYLYSVTVDGLSWPSPLVVEVRQDVVAKVYPEGIVVPSEEPYDAANFPTVPDLFDTIQEAITTSTTDGDNITSVIYNEMYGYPEEITAFANSSSVMITVNQMTLYTILGWEFDDAKKLWNDLNFTNYDYDEQIICYCDFDDIRPKRVNIRGGDIANAIFLDTEETVMDLRLVTTVEATFDRIQRSLTQGNYASSIMVSYHPFYGYPASAYIDLDSRLADDEITIQIFNLAPLQDYSQAEGNLYDAMSLWSSHSLNLYSFGYQRTCFCLPEYTDPVIVQVQNTTVTSVTSRFQDPVSEDVFNQVPSMEELFSMIQAAIDDSAYSIDVTYDQDYGYPASIYIDYDSLQADEELWVTVDYLSPISEWWSDFNEHKSLWDTQDIDTYTYVFQRSCECLPQDTAPKQVDVVDGMVVSVDGQSASVDGQPLQAFANIPTIDGLFDKIQQAIDSNPYRMNIQYDETLGYPSNMFIDYEEKLADEEFIVSAQHFLFAGSPTPSIEDSSTPSPSSSPTGEELPSSGSRGLHLVTVWFSLIVLNLCKWW